MVAARDAIAVLLVTVSVNAPPALAQRNAPASAPRPLLLGTPPASAPPFAAARRLKLQPPPLDLGAVPAPQRREPIAGTECAPAWACRFRLFGVIDKTGGVGLKGPALTW